MFALRSALFEMAKLKKDGPFRMILNSPKAEVRGSNPFGRASLFNGLRFTRRIALPTGKHRVSTRDGNGPQAHFDRLPKSFSAI
jgi:hypothetical protein